MAGTTQRGLRALDGISLPERYQVQRRIADGGMASVWCAHDRTLGRNVAIKLLSSPYAHDRGAVLRFKREARTAARVSGHPHVVTIYDVGEAEDHEAPFGRAFIVMEYLPGGTVADALRVGAVSRAQATRWVREAAEALDYAHGHGVIHRDIKPANFLLDADRVLHVADFGIARLGGEETISSVGEMLGTAAYIDPERALGRPATEASDRYALAVAAFELLVGERPFKAEHFAAQARAHVEEEPPRASMRNPQLPRAVDPVLARGMAKRPEDRWPSATEFAIALERAFSGAPRAAAAPVIVAGRRRPPRSLAVAALAAAALGVGIAAAASQGPSASSSRRTNARAAAGKVTRTSGHRGATGRHARSTPHVSTPTAATTTPPPTVDTLQARGHQLMLGGNYQAAVEVLRRAVSAAAPGSLTYAYALFDLGRSLRLAGDPRAAAQVLYERLQIPNQTNVVRAELQLALQALGQRAAQSGGATPSPGPPGHHGHGNNGHGGDKSD